MGIIPRSSILYVLSIVFCGGVIIFCGSNIRKYVYAAFIALPVDSFMLDISKALLNSLRESSLIERSQSIDNIRVVIDAQGYYDVYIDYASAEDAKTFSTCLNEILAPVTSQRYLISRSEDDIDVGFYSPVWWTMRKFFRIVTQENIAYHAVPEVLSVNKVRAQLFADNWRKYVGGGQLVYTRSQEGVEKLVEIRAFNRHKLKRMQYEIWK